MSTSSQTPEPLSPERHAEIRQWRDELGSQKDFAAVGPYSAIRDLLAENDRLTAELAKYVGHEPTIAEEMQYLNRENERLTARVAEMEAYEALNPQQCPRGLHAEWLVDSEHAHACPWCRIAELEGTQEATPLALPWAHRMSDWDLHCFLDDLVSAAIDRWRSEPSVPDRQVLASIEKACAEWRTPGQGSRSDDPETVPDTEAGDR